MNSQTYKQKSLVIVYDASIIPKPGRQLFDPDYWEQSGKVSGYAPGRGSAILLETEFGPAVLRRYLRGGWAARISRERYIFTGFELSRPLHEFRILEQLLELKLPVPQPLAAICERSGATFTGALLTRRITGAQTLADMLPELLRDDPVNVAPWAAIGSCIRRFHDCGVIHADLNARNIMLRDDYEVFLIDFDRARIREGADMACMSNIRRLHRSLEKLWPAMRRDKLDTCWQTMLTAYDTEITRTSPAGEPAKSTSGQDEI